MVSEMIKNDEVLLITFFTKHKILWNINSTEASLQIVKKYLKLKARDNFLHPSLYQSCLRVLKLRKNGFNEEKVFIELNLVFDIGTVE